MAPVAKRIVEEIGTCEEGRRAPAEKIPGKVRGRQKTRWKDSCNRDMESVRLKVENVMDRRKRKREIQYTILATSDDGRSQRRIIVEWCWSE